MPPDPPRLGHLLFYEFSPHVDTTLKSLAMPLVLVRYHAIGPFSPCLLPPFSRCTICLAHHLTAMLYDLNTWDGLPKDLKNGFYKGVSNK